MRRFLSILGVLWCGVAGAQDMPAAVEQKLEDWSENAAADMEDDSYWQNLEYYKRHPVNINMATKEVWQVFKFLTDLQIDHLLQHRRLLGDLITVYELQAVSGWDMTTIQRILPFVTVSAGNAFGQSFADRFRKGNHSLLLRETKVPEPARGYNTDLRTHYQGRSDHLFLRYKYRYGQQLQYGFVADKGAGEPFFKGANASGFDFYSAHLYAQNIGPVKTLAIGDFTVNMGQGLIQWQTLAFKKSADVMAIKRQAAEILPYNSAGSFFFHRGIGLTVTTGPIEITAFASYKPVNANTKFDTSRKETVVTSFITSDYHRTASEIADKNSLHQTTLGGSVHYKKKAFTIGLNAVHYRFSLPLQKRDAAYNLYAIRGKTWSNASTDYSYTYKNMHFFGEAALDRKGRSAWVNGVLMSISPKVDAALLYRHMDKAYQSLYSNAFTENTAPTNESGWYIGLTFRPVAAWRLDGYADFYRFPWLKFGIDAPSAGRDYLVQATYQPNKKFETFVRYKNENKTAHMAGGIADKGVTQPKHNIRAHMAYRLNHHLSLRSRVEAVFQKAEATTERGFLSYIEGVYKPTAKFATSLRCQYFSTDSYDTRIYAYEQDVLYSYSIPFFYDTGLRYYLNINYDISKKLSLWGRWAQTVYYHKNTIGSGLEAISGKRKSEIKLQVRYLFQ